MNTKHLLNRILAQSANLGFKPQEVDALKVKLTANPSEIPACIKQLEAMEENAKPKPIEKRVVWAEPASTTSSTFEQKADRKLMRRS